MNKKWTPRIFCSYQLTEYGVIFYGKKDDGSSRQSRAEAPSKCKSPDACGSDWIPVGNGSGSGADRGAVVGDVCRTGFNLGGKWDWSGAGLHPRSSSGFFLRQKLGAEWILFRDAVCSNFVYRLFSDFSEPGREPLSPGTGKAVFDVDLWVYLWEHRGQYSLEKTGIKKAGAKRSCFLCKVILLWKAVQLPHQHCHCHWCHYHQWFQLPAGWMPVWNG